MIKATIGGVPVEIWFTPSFNIKTTSKELEKELRRATLTGFDPWKTRVRDVRVTMGEREAYIFLILLKEEIPELKVKITEHPELPKYPIDESKELLF